MSTERTFIHPENLSLTELNSLKQRTRDFVNNALKKKNLTRDDITGRTIRKLDTDLPSDFYDLLCIPDYQHFRQDKNKDAVNEIVANFNPMFFNPPFINYRTDGPYSDLLMMNDGERRTTSAFILNLPYIPVSITSQTEADEILIFAKQDEGKTRVDILSKYEAFIKSTDDSDIGVKAAKTVQKALQKYNLDITINRFKLSGPLAIVKPNAAKQLRADAESRLDWVTYLLKASNFYTSYNGLRSNAWNALDKVWTRCQQGMFGTASPEDIKPIICDFLTGKCYNGLQTLAVNNLGLTAQAVSYATDDRAIVADVISAHVCKELGITWVPPVASTRKKN